MSPNRNIFVHWDRQPRLDAVLAIFLSLSYNVPESWCGSKMAMVQAFHFRYGRRHVPVLWFERHDSFSRIRCLRRHGAPFLNRLDAPWSGTHDGGPPTKTVGSEQCPYYEQFSMYRSYMFSCCQLRVQNDKIGSVVVFGYHFYAHQIFICTGTRQTARNARGRES